MMIEIIVKILFVIGFVVGQTGLIVMLVGGFKDDEKTMMLGTKALVISVASLMSAVLLFAITSII